MTGQPETLVRFTELKVSPNTAPVKVEATIGAIPQEIERLRYRLISGDFHDSVDVKAMIVGELVYLTYKELITRKRLL